MSNGAALNISQSSFLLAQDDTEEGTFVSLGAHTYPEGTVLGRVTASSKFTPYVAGAVDGSEIPLAILLVETTTAGIADVPMWVLVEGATKEALTLVWTAGVPVPPTPAERDLLRSMNILVKPVTEMNTFDNALP